MQPIMLFDNGILHHASDAALEALPVAVGSYDWDDLRVLLKPRFPDFPKFADLKPEGGMIIKERESTANAGTEIHIDRCADKMRVCFESADGTLGGLTAASPADMSELETLQQMSRTLPHPVWKTDSNNRTVWTNEAYRILNARREDPPSGNSAPLFNTDQPQLSREGQRIGVNVSGSIAPEWYKVARHALPDGAIYHATALDAVIAAEEAQRAFVQTLAKTFAHLSIGLAVFNRDRQLALFNPALVDLTGLPVAFLSPQPTVDSFFDSLRENRRMPEPKNYRSWRQRIADLISAAEVGNFEENWSLENGQTYRIKGRPHPDGAIAFLIEDISAEVAMARSCRAELELSQSLLDTFDDAIVVFSQSGVLAFSNSNYDRIWGHQPDTSLSEVTIADAIQIWMHKSEPNPMWYDLRDCVLNVEDRVAWDMPVCLKGKPPMTCRIVPITSGATMVRFSQRRPSLPLSQPNMKLQED